MQRTVQGGYLIKARDRLDPACRVMVQLFQDRNSFLICRHKVMFLGLLLPLSLQSLFLTHAAAFSHEMWHTGCGQSLRDHLMGDPGLASSWQWAALVSILLPMLAGPGQVQVATMQV